MARILEYQVPNDEEGTECTRAVEQDPRTAGPLACPFEFLVSPSNVFCCGEGILHQLLDMLVLFRQIGDKG